MTKFSLKCQCYSLKRSANVLKHHPDNIPLYGNYTDDTCQDAKIKLTLVFWWCNFVFVQALKQGISGLFLNPTMGVRLSMLTN